MQSRHVECVVVLENRVRLNIKSRYLSELPIKTYFECIGLLASRGYYDLLLRIINDKVTKDNIDIAIDEFNNSIKPWHKVEYDCYNKVKEVLEKNKL